jgi:predicted DNA binding protein
MKNIELKYYTEPKNPIYKGEFEIIHKDCPFSYISKEVGSDFQIKVLEQEKDKSHRVRFDIQNALTKDGVRDILTNASKITPINYASVWVNGGTRFELKVVEPILKSVEPIRIMPFGQLSNYMAFPEKETFKLIAPGDSRISGKERLLEVEEALKKFGDAELRSFQRISKDDFLEQTFNLRRFAPSMWLTPNEFELLERAIELGYFETPKRINLDDLAKQLNISKTTLNEKLRSVNRSIMDRFLKMTRGSLPP